MNLQAAVAWYSKLARDPGWADYAIDAARELKREHPAEFEKLPGMLLKAHPSLALCRMERSNETRANTYRLQPSRFHVPSVVAHKRKERA